MLDTKIEERLNQQINAELYSAYLYLSIAAYMNAQDLPGAAAWMRSQALEERGHAMRFYDHIEERGGRVRLQAIDGPPHDFGTPLQAFEQSLAHEREITGKINDLVDLAIQLNDHATRIFLQWFVTEQVEEEASVEAVVNDLRRVGNDGPGLLFIDKQLGVRPVEHGE